jgi:hypothetical protein
MRPALNGFGFSRGGSERGFSSWHRWTSTGCAAGSPSAGSLARADTERLLDACQSLLEQRAAIARILDELGLSWTGARRALDELHPGDAG